MTKRYLYIVLALIGGVVFFMLFIPDEVTIETTPAPVSTNDALEESEGVQEEIISNSTDRAATESEQEQLILTGMFVGLLNGEDKYRKKFTYLLLNDGSEILRIDLRPLIGYSDIDIIGKLGVGRGDEVEITGVIKDVEFSIESIAGVQ